jgi:nucleoid-associated protein YgaU
MTVDASLAKLTLRFEVKREGVFQGVIPALFNPNRLRYSRSVSWDSDPTAITSKEAEYHRLRFKSTGFETLQIQLFFDTYEEERDPLLPAVGPTRPRAPSVRPHIDLIASLTRFDRELHRPPVCELYWGGFFLFKGVLQTLTQELTLFLEDGTPVRATCDCTFLQHQTREDRLSFELHSADVAKRYTVLPGDTLASIAAEVYQDATLWRPIADENRIQNPRRLVPGQVLTIPKIR